METTKDLNSLIIEIINTHAYKITPLALKNLLASESQFSGNVIESAIKLLITDGTLMYTNHFGSSYLENSIKNPVRLSKKVILKPPEVKFESHENDVVINLISGSAFGTGEHPSTRLAVTGLEYILEKNRSESIRDTSSMLDIGTGSGILALTALKMGIKKAVGIDIDPCAVYEAKLNAKINDLENRLSVSDDSIETFIERFDLITANLRYPTLIKLFRNILVLSYECGIIILSGIKIDEIPAIQKVYTETSFDYIWSEREKGWACLAIQKKEGGSSV